MKQESPAVKSGIPVLQGREDVNELTTIREQPWTTASSMVVTTIGAGRHVQLRREFKSNRKQLP